MPNWVWYAFTAGFALLLIVALALRARQGKKPGS